MNVFENRTIITSYVKPKIPITFHHSLTEISDETAISPADVHLYYELLYLISGNLEYKIEGITYKILPGDIILVNSNEIHILKIDLSAKYERMVLQFNKNLIPSEYEFFQELLEPFSYTNSIYRVMPSKIVEKFKVKDILDKIESYCQKQPDFLPAVLLSCLYELLIELNAALNYIKFSEKTIYPQFTENSLMRKIFKYVENNLYESFDLDKMAKELFISKYYMCHLFKEWMGMSLKKYINFKKIVHSEHLLNQGMTPQEVCDKMGFAYYSSFFYNFKLYMKRAPTEKYNMID